MISWAGASPQRFKLMKLNVMLSLSLFMVGQLLPRGSASLDSNELLSMLLELHKEHCGDSALCAGSSHFEPTQSLFPLPCCLPCSCLQTCVERQNCCPYSRVDTRTTRQNIQPRREQNEFLVGSENDTLEQQSNISSNSFSLLDSLVNQEENHQTKTSHARPANIKQHQATKEDDDHKTRSIGAENETITDKIILASKAACIRPQIFYKPNAFPDSIAYEMIVSCPERFQESTTTVKCRSAMNNDNIEDIIPLTSKVTGLTYVNKYCLLCNEEEWYHEHVAYQWRINIISYTSDYAHRFLPSPLSLMTTQKILFSNIYFSPREEVTVRSCNAADVTFCNQTGLWDLRNETIEKLCLSGRTLPVTHRINGETLIFKNIACIHCNTHSSFKNRTLDCAYFPYLINSPHSLTVNLNSEERIEDHDEDISIPSTEDFILQKLISSACSEGFVDILGRCRRVICPRDHYARRNQCVALYDTLSGLVLNVKLKITPVQEISSAISPEFVEELRSMVFNNLKKINALNHHNVSFWYLPKINTDIAEYYLFDIIFYNYTNIIKYRVAVKAIKEFFNYIKSHGSVQLSNGTNVVVKCSFGFGIERRHNVLIDKRVPTKRTLRPLMEEGWTMGKDYASMKISSVNWCYRIRFTSSEINDLGSVIRIKQTRSILFMEEFDVGLNRNTLEFYICIDYVIDEIGLGQSNLHTHTHKTGIDEEVEGNTDFSSIFTDRSVAMLVLLSVFAVLGVVFFRARMLCKKTKTSRYQQKSRVN